MKATISLLCILLLLQTSGQSVLTAEQWQEDLRILRETVHSDYQDLFVKTTPEIFNEEVEKLSNQIPNLEDHEIAIGMMKIISLFKYGHTDVGTRGSVVTLRHLPLNLYHFSDGMYVQGTNKDHEKALGARVIAIENTPIEKALELVYPVVPAENDQYFKAFGINYLRIPEVLHAIGITENLKDEIVFQLEKDGKPFTQKFKVLPAEERPPVKYSLIRQEGDWLDIRDQDETPHYLKNLDRKFHWEYLEDKKAVYVRQSSVFHEDDLTIADFYEEVFEFIDKNEVQKLVIDVRLNGGGNNYNNKSVIRGIVRSKKIDQVGKFFVIIGRRTFSACQNLVNEFSNYTNAIFVGEPTAENINFFGDNRQVELPNSKLTAYLSFAWWQDKPVWENGPWLAPHLAVEMSFDEYRTNQDPVLQTALDFQMGEEGFVLDPMQYLTQLFETGQIDKVQSEATRLVNNPTYKFFDFEGQFNRTGYNLMGDNRMKEAVFVLQMNAQLFPESANCWDSLAEAHLKSGDKEKAIELYNKAIELDPDGPTAKNAREMLKSIENPDSH